MEKKPQKSQKPQKKYVIKKKLTVQEACEVIRYLGYSAHPDDGKIAIQDSLLGEEYIYDDELSLFNIVKLIEGLNRAFGIKTGKALKSKQLRDILDL